MNEYNGTTYDDTAYEGSSTEGKSSEEIRAEIERKRSQMTEKIDTIQDRLSPDNLKLQAQTMVQDIIQESTDAIIDFARTGSKQAGRSLLDTIKANPLPSAVIGVGLGWLAMNMMKSQDDQGQSDRYGYQGSYGSMYDRRQMEYGPEYSTGAGYTGSYSGSYSATSGRGMGQGAMTGARVPYTGEYGYENEGSIGDKLGKVGDAAKSAVGKVGETAQNIAGLRRRCCPERSGCRHRRRRLGSRCRAGGSRFDDRRSAGRSECGRACRRRRRQHGPRGNACRPAGTPPGNAGRTHRG